MKDQYTKTILSFLPLSDYFVVFKNNEQYIWIYTYFFNETGYLIPLVETVGVNQQGKRAIALAPCFLAPTVSTRGIKYPCFILTRYLMHCLTNQRQVKVSLLKTLSKCSCWKFWAKKTRYLFGQWESLFHIKYLVKLYWWATIQIWPSAKRISRCIVANSLCLHKVTWFSATIR